MKVITIAARKGGAGKSTLSAHFSVLAEQGGARVLLIDCDPQGSLAFWWRRREGGTPQLIETASRELPKIIERARKDGVGFVIVDTPPHAEISILDAMRVADLVLVPTRPGPFDLAAVAATLALAREVRKVPLVAINHAPPAVGWGEPAIVGEAREALGAMRAKVAANFIKQRVALSHALISGQTVGEFAPSSKGAAEIAALWREIQSELT